MMGSDIKESVVENFCDKTTIHGFHEFRTSGSICFKILWVLIIIVGSLLTCYQVYSVLVNFKQNPTKTLILPLHDQVPKYPPVQICYPHWIYWVNWTKILEIKLDPETLLYAMSLLMPSYSSKQFNVSQVEKSFNEMVLPSLNLSHIMDFYLYISNDLPYNIMRRSAKQFKRGFNEQWYTEFCYTVTSNAPKSEGTVLRLTFASKNLESADEFMSKFNFSEEFRYATRWAYFYSTDGTDAGVDVNTTVIAPFFIYPLNNDYDFLTVDVSTYYHFDVHLTANVYRWQNNDNKPCFELESSFQKSSPTCMHNCFSSDKFSSPYCGLTFVNNVVYDDNNSIYSPLPNMSYDHCSSIFSS